PNLGVVSYGEEKSFVVADIPGLIEGAHRGAGLGLDFLRHVERTKLLAFIIDISSAPDRDPVSDFETLVAELRSYKAELLEKPNLVVASKADVLDDPGRFERLESFCRNRGLEVIVISSVTGLGIKQLVERLGQMVEEQRLVEIENEAAAAKSGN